MWREAPLPANSCHCAPTHNHLSITMYALSAYQHYYFIFFSISTHSPDIFNKIFHNKKMLKEFYRKHLYTYHLDSTINILLYLLDHIHLSIHLIFDVFITELQTTVYFSLTTSACISLTTVNYLLKCIL